MASSHTSAPAESGGVRAKILAAAQHLIAERGFAALTQTRMARAAGVRQSHLTYYFPRRADLLVALLTASHHHAEGEAEEGDVYDALAALVFERRRSGFFLSALVETSDDPAVRAAVTAHMDRFRAHMAHRFGRPESDADVALFVSALRGMTLENLAAPEPEPAPARRIRALATRLGLVPRPEKQGLI